MNYQTNGIHGAPARIIVRCTSAANDLDFHEHADESGWGLYSCRTCRVSFATAGQTKRLASAQDGMPEGDAEFFEFSTRAST